jgi:hypothetical protein
MLMVDRCTRTRSIEDARPMFAPRRDPNLCGARAKIL